MMIWTFSSRRRRRAAAVAPPATPPTMMTFMVCIAHKAGALDHDDLDILVQAAQARRGGCSSGDAADDDDFHGEVPFDAVRVYGGARGDLSGPAGQTSGRCRPY